MIISIYRLKIYNQVPTAKSNKALNSFIGQVVLSAYSLSMSNQIKFKKIQI